MLSIKVRMVVTFKSRNLPLAGPIALRFYEGFPHGGVGQNPRGSSAGRVRVRFRSTLPEFG